MPIPTPPPVPGWPLPTVVQDLLILVLPSGGQRVARRNAWAGMSADAARSRARREAEAAMELAARRAAQRSRTGS